MDGGWTVSVSEEYDYIGPFPLSAREQQFLSPAYPLDLDLNAAYVHDPSARFPSSLSDNGQTGWLKGASRQGQEYAVSYPSVRWKHLRDTFGWAALQHHSLIHTVVSFASSRGGSELRNTAMRLDVLLRLKQASFVCFISRGEASNKPDNMWIESDIYAQSPHSRVVALPISGIVDDKLVFDVFLSVDYEIRLFGDPRFTEAEETPVSRVYLSIDIYNSSVVHIEGPSIVPDFVEGWALGDALGIYIQNNREWNSLASVTCDSTVVEFKLEPPSTRLAPLQRRLISLRIVQRARLLSHVDTLFLAFLLESGSIIYGRIELRHKAHWSSDSTPDLILRQTHRLPALSYSMLLPPVLRPDQGVIERPLLALHGAGVEAGSESWTSAVKRREHNWVIFARGLTPWGYDWHGPSALDALAALDALRRRELDVAPTAVVIGHSNGGQGALHLGAHFPDIFKGSIPVAAYLTSAAYVPTTLSQGTHFAEPALQGILNTSLAGDDNDFFLCNLASRRTRIFHGGDDENVPVWNSRKAFDIIRTYNHSADTLFTEIPGKPHWWDGVLRTKAIENAIDDLLVTDAEPPEGFVLTVLWPWESGSLNGWEIAETDIPGRFGRLKVWGNVVQTTNVVAFSAPNEFHGELIVDGQPLSLGISKSPIWAVRADAGVWKLSGPYDVQRAGPLSRILSYGSPIALVVPSLSNKGGSLAYLFTAALRLAHNLLSFLNIDCNIVLDTEITANSDSYFEDTFSGGVVVFGEPGQNSFAAQQLNDTDFPIQFRTGGGFIIQKRVFNTKGIGEVADVSMRTIIGWAHHWHDVEGLIFMKERMMFICGSDAGGFNRALRAFPLRTGVPNPEWLVLGPHTDRRSIGGILGAGFWDRKGKFSKEMSWIG